MATVQRLSASKALLRGSRSQVYLGLTWKLFKSRCPGCTPRPMESDSVGRDPAWAVIHIPKGRRDSVQTAARSFLKKSYCCYIS